MDADQFRYRMSQLPKPETDQKPPYWSYWRLDLWQRAQAQDPARFWEWPCCYHTMLVNHWQSVIDYEYSKVSGTRLIEPCHIPHFGPDDRYIIHPRRVSDLYTVTGLSMNLIHQAYHLHQWETTTGHKINHLDTIVEFGGGYGAMALLCHRLGFEGKYIIYDLPEFSLLQEYYLSQFGLLAGVEWNPKRKPKNVDLFMALYSLSEVEPGKRDKYLGWDVNSYLFLYSGQWEAWNNIEFFQEIWPGNSNFQWQHTELSHLPDLGNYYSIGW